MAINKKSFLVYSNWAQTFENLTDEEAGKLIKHVFRYVNDENPIAPDRITEIVFEPLKAVLKSDLIKYENVKEEKSISGRTGNLKRWNNDLFLLVESNKMTLEDAENIAKNRKISVSDKIIANATKQSHKIAVNVNDNDIKINNINLSVNWVGLLEQFNLITNKKLRVIDDKTKRQVIARLKDGYTKADLVLAITNCFNDDYHKENPKYLTLEFITRPDKMQKYCQDFKNIKPTKKIDKL